MGRTLKEDLARDFHEVFLNEKEHSEWVTFYPAGGGRSRRLLVTVTKPRRDVADRGDVEMDEEEIIVEAGRDESHAHGGIAFPCCTGSDADTLVRDGDEDLDRFAFSGRIESETPHSRRLHFTRPRPLRIGTEQRQR